MTIREYADKVAKIVTSETGKETKTCEVSKREGNLVAISVKINDTISRLYYVEQDYDDGVPAESCAKNVKREIADTEKDAERLKTMDFSWDAIKDCIEIMVMDSEMRAGFLADKPHRDLSCGLSLTAYVWLDDGYGFTVSDTIAEFWGLDADAVINKGLRNIKAQREAVLFPFAEFEKKNPKNLLTEENDCKSTDIMYVLTNNIGRNGSATLFLDGMLERIKSILGCPYFVLPSSIHEVMILPVTVTIPLKGLKAMLCGANATVVEANEFLSDNVYYYDTELKEVM